MFREVFGGGPVSTATLVAHFDAPLRHAAAAVAAAHRAEEALGDALRPTWLQHLRDAAAKTAFTCGIDVQAPFAAEVASPSLQAARSEQLQRQAAERRSADRLQQVKQAGELLSQWEQLRKTAPGASAGQLLSQVPAESRGEVLRTLLLADADRAAPVPLWCVAGPNLVRIAGETATAVPLPPAVAAVGPLRSVSPGESGLLLGGQRGVVSVATGGVFLDTDLKSEHGFTRVVQRTDGIYGTHRDGGVVRWAATASQPDRVWRPAELGGVPRHLIVGGEHLLFAVEQRVMQLDRDGELHELFAAGSPIVALLKSENRIIVVESGGAVGVFDAHGFAAAERLRRRYGRGRRGGTAAVGGLGAAAGRRLRGADRRAGIG